ncbi:BirA family transcriptional regulator [Parelusimicrobium proximum]|uniref:biotin--[acetyl-CoA-carboxylase] ligase n=1 Tax=Parelusimicrobium proximum TaxID=3228953 RepID=UPI003D16FF0F
MISRIIRVDLIDTTQNLAKELARSGADSGTVVIAEDQTAGRGQFDRGWISGKGGLFVSLVLRPEKPMELNASLSLKVASVISGVLTKLYGIKTKIKYPNDVLAYHPKKKKWLKICGILIESSAAGMNAEWLVIGAGINLNNKIPASLPAAVSVKNITGKEYDLRALEAALLEEFSLRYRDWLSSSV